MRTGILSATLFFVLSASAFSQTLYCKIQRTSYTFYVQKNSKVLYASNLNDQSKNTSLESPEYRPEIVEITEERGDWSVRLAHLDISSKSEEGHVVAPLHLSGPADVRVSISDMTGKQIKSFRKNFNEGGYKEWFIDMHNMRDGVYILTFMVNGEKTVRKIIKDDIRMA